MKELDFDELDRAVSSLMSDAGPSTPSSSDTPREKILDIPSSGPAVKPVMSFGTLEPEVLKNAIDDSSDDDVVAKPVTATAPALRRAGGRFMDVVHPSSDMKQASNASQSASRQGVTISPTPSPLIVPSELPEIVADVAAPAESVVPDVEPVEVESTGDWPDPLELASKKVSDEIVIADEPAVEALAVETTVVEEIKPVVEVQPEQDKEPLSSPFLSDAKVEKRPLGTNTPLAPIGLSDVPINEPIPDATLGDNQVVTDPPVFEAPLPEELQQDLVAIESGESQTTGMPEVSSIETNSVSDAGSAGSTRLVKALIPEHISVDDASKGPASIAQQYKEQPSSSDQSNGAIYDTEAYHKPLAHPAKKSSGWMWVIWIVLVLAIGAGIGATLYYLGIVK